MIKTMLICMGVVYNKYLKSKRREKQRKKQSRLCSQSNEARNQKIQIICLFYLRDFEYVKSFHNCDHAFVVYRHAQGLGYVAAHFKYIINLFYVWFVCLVHQFVCGSFGTSSTCFFANAQALTINLMAMGGNPLLFNIFS